MRNLRFALMAAVCFWQVLSLGVVLDGQTAAPPATTDDIATIKAQTRLVLVDTVVTDKKGNYLEDLTAKDFRVWEDDKEQKIKSFSLESASADPNHSQKHYLVLFFDNSTLSGDDQVRARKAAAKFIENNASPEHLIAVVDFGGATRISQNFTSDVARLQKAVSGIKGSSVSPNDDSSIQLASLGTPNLSNVAADFGAHTVMIALKNIAKGLSSVPGRKTLVFLTTGFPLNAERQSELTTVIDTCNKANVSVYPIDARGLVGPFGKLNRHHDGIQVARGSGGTFPLGSSWSDSADHKAHLVYAAWQHAGGGGGHVGGGGGGTGGGGGHVGGGGGGKIGGGGGKVGGGGTRVGSSSTPFNRGPVQAPRLIVPQFPDISANDQLLYALAEGTGGFVIHNSNDLLAGMQKIAKDQDQYYVLSYAPPDSPEGSCHTLKVKVDRSGTVIRSRSGYCNVKPVDVLAGKPQEKDLENRVTGSQAGDIAASVEAPYFYVSPNTARVNLAMEIPTGSVKFEKQKGAQHAEINVLGVAYKPDGSVAGRFSDTVNLDFDGKKEVEEFAKKPLHYENQFELASGHYTLKIAFNAGEKSFGKLELPLIIDPYDEKQFSLSALALSHEMRRISDMATGIDAELLEDHTPLVVRGMQIIPAGTNRFKASESAEIYFEVYDPLLLHEKPPKVMLQYSVVNVKSGERKLDVSVTNTEGSIVAGSRVVPIGLKLPVDSLTPGDYRVEIRALDLAGNSSPTRTAAFQIE